MRLEVLAIGILNGYAFPITLDFVVNRFLMKLFKTSKIDVIDDIRNYFCVELPSETIGYRILKYSRKCSQIRPSLYRWLMNV